MKQSVLILLFISVIDRILLQGIYPILPVLVSNLGATAKSTGIFMVVTYIAIAIGSMLTPTILKFYSSVSKLSFFIAGITAFSLYEMGTQTTYTGMLVATAGYWFLSGIQINIYSIMMSFVSPAEQTGRNFGLLASTTLVGSVIGSFFIGPFIHLFGNQTSFGIFGLVTIITRFAMALSNYDFVYSRNKYIGPFQIKKKLWLLLLTLNTGMMLSFIGRFNLSLLMKEMHYTLGDISFVFGVGSLIVFPLPYVFGWLSQKIAGKILLVIALASVAISMFILYKGHNYPSFLWVSFLICIMTYCSRGVTQKLIYDMYPLKQQTQAQSLLTSANWVAAILGFMVVSFTADFLPMEQVSLIGGVLGVISMVALAFF